MFDAGSIAERTPEENKQIKIAAKQDGNIQIQTCESTYTNLYTIHKKIQKVKPVRVGPCALCSTGAASCKTQH